MRYPRILHLLGLFCCSVVLSACLGNSGGEDTGGGYATTPEDAKVAAVGVHVAPESAKADGAAELTIDVLARDANGLPLSGVSVNFVSASDWAVLTPPSGLTGADGRFVTRVTDTKVETFEVVPVVAGRRRDPVTLRFIATLGGIDLTAEAALLAPQGSTLISLAVRRQLDGAAGDPLPDTPFTVSVGGPAQLGEVPARTDAEGQARFSLSATGPGVIDLVVSSGPLSQTLRLYAGASLALVPPASNAIGAVTLTALLKDSNNAPLPGQTVHFAFAGSNQETLEPASAVTGGDGTAQVKVVDLGQDGGSVTVSAVAGQLSAQASVDFLAALGQGQTLQVIPSATVLSTAQSAGVTARIQDATGAPVAGQPINFSVDGNARLSVSAGVTDGNGEVKTQVSDGVGENVTLTAQAGTARQTLTLYFGARLALLPAHGQGTADGGTAVELTASLTDAGGAGIPGIGVNFRASGSALLNAYRVTSDARGQAKVRVTDTAAETVTVSAGADALAPASAGIDFSHAGAGVPASITLSRNPPEPQALSLNGTATVTATVRDAQGLPVKDGTLIRFTGNGVGTVSASALTRNGQAAAVFNAGGSAGLAVVTATWEQLSASTTFQITPGDAGVIEVKQIVPPIIGITGSGIAQSATLQFLVKDNLGNPVADGTPVHFSLGQTTLGGGESITTGGGAGNEADGQTSNGLVSVTLRSGSVAGSVDVIARAGEISTLARVTIVGGLPDADHFSLAVQYLNIAGGVHSGLQDMITAFVGDRFGNVVPDGTAVSFVSEGGTIGKSPGSAGGAFTVTTEFGQAGAVLQSAAPTTPSLGGIATLRDQGHACAGDYAFHAANPDNLLLCGNPGLVTVLAYTPGSESFVDNNGDGVFKPGVDRFSDPGYLDRNGNGQWDLGEPITGKGDLSEPYLDANDSGTFELGEFYIDVNRNGHFDGPDGVYQDNTTVWAAIRVLFSASTGKPRVVPETFSLFGYQTQQEPKTQVFYIYDISDIYGNALVAGTQIKVSAVGGILGGTTEFKLTDSQLPPAPVSFTLSSEPRGNSGYPSPKIATVTVSVIPPDTTNLAPGGNGTASSVVISGSINN